MVEVSLQYVIRPHDQLSQTLKVMAANTHFRLNDAEIVHETFDDEILAINLETGTYYSMPGLSGQIWRSIVSGVPIKVIDRALHDVIDLSPDDISTLLREFVGKLEQNRLVLPAEGQPSNDDQLTLLSASGKFEPVLVFDIFTDMQDLLLLDPIHHVEEEGWPLAKSAVDASDE